VPLSAAAVRQAKKRFRTASDKYGFYESFRNRSVNELIASLNGGVGVTAWVTARGYHLAALRDALLATGLDCSSFISDSGMSLASRVERRGDAIVQINPSESQGGIILIDPDSAPPEKRRDAE